MVSFLKKSFQHTYSTFMKNIRIFWLGVLIPLVVGCFGFWEEPIVDPLWETRYRPILMERSELEAAIRFEAPQPIRNAGKIYFKEGILFLNEKYEGIHVIDNRNPSTPQPLGFIRIPGCIDMAAYGNFLYADNAVDLLAFNLSNPRNPTFANRKQSVFPELPPPDLTYVPYRFTAENRPANTVIIGWELSE